MNRKVIFFYVASFKHLNKIGIVSPVLKSAPPYTHLPPPPSPLHDCKAEAKTIRAKDMQGAKNKTTVYFNTRAKTAAPETEIKHGNIFSNYLRWQNKHFLGGNSSKEAQMVSLKIWSKNYGLGW